MSIENKSLKKKLEDINARVEVAGSELGKELARLSKQAIFQGRNSQAWKDYMRAIVGPGANKQFLRLTFQDAKQGEEYVINSNVYIVANAVCGSQTTTRTLDGIEDPDRLDEDLPMEPFDVPPPPQP